LPYGVANNAVVLAYDCPSIVKYISTTCCRAIGFEVLHIVHALKKAYAHALALVCEVLFYVDRGDVTEELTRLTSHFGQFRAFLASTEPVGRNMDFLAQEIFREITTLGNKAAVSGASPLVVAFKAEMEKIREQIQNIE
jgi:uncharacterized protein (TIGR00255 family)